MSQDDDYDPVEVFPDDEMDLRTGADGCYKCSTCDTACPVAEVDDEFPGPKFQGPEQWRLRRKEGHEIDDSITHCSNCMRCDDACPTEVPLSQMHNEARARHADENGLPLRNRLLANYRTAAAVASKVPRLANFLTGLSAGRWLAERLLGVTAEREFPEFAAQTFREWWDERGGARVESDSKRVAYFHGCYANYNTPEVGRALVRTFEAFGYEVTVPEQRCSGTPMFANGALDDARRDARVNVDALGDCVAEGYDVVCSCTSCSMALRQEYPELFDVDGVERVAENTYEAVEYLRLFEDLRGELEAASVDAGGLAYHTPCHARNQGLAGRTVELFDRLDGAAPADVGDSCSGISGTYGWKAEHYETSMAVGEEMFEEMETVPGETGLTECPTCAMQMEHGTGYEVRHPLELLEDALVDDA
ncbi:MAG: anaerobic glycerol-3-phosphate dehydrogenase subunit C [Halobacteriaceae archaeon]